MSGETVVCGRECWVSSLHFAMSDRDFRGHRTANKIRHSANSSRDPGVSATRSTSSRSSNARTHPKADSYSSYHASHHNSHHGNSQQTPSASNRKAQAEALSSQDVWTEHMSSKGRVYYFNQRTEKSQWTRPTTGTVKRLKESSEESEVGGVNETGSSTSQDWTTGSHQDSREAWSRGGGAKEEQDGQVEVDHGSNYGCAEQDGCLAVEGRGLTLGGRARAIPRTSVSRSGSNCSTPTHLTSPTPTPLLCSPAPTSVLPSPAPAPLLPSPAATQLPPLAQGLHPLQQALLLRQSALLRATTRNTTSPEDIADVSMEISSSSPSPCSSPVSSQPSGSSVPLAPSTATTTVPAKPCVLQTLLSPHPAPDPSLLPPPVAVAMAAVEQEEKEPGTPTTVNSPAPHHSPPLAANIGGDIPLFRSALTYNAIADLPSQLREPLPHPAIQVDSFQPNLTEFWYTPANEMMEKQIHQSANEFIFKTVSMTHRLDSHLTKLDVTLQRSSVLLFAQQSRLQSLKAIAKDIEDLR